MWPKASRWAASGRRVRRSTTFHTCTWAFARPARRTAISIRFRSSLREPPGPPIRPLRRPSRPLHLPRSRRRRRHRLLPRLLRRRLRRRRRQPLSNPHPTWPTRRIRLRRSRCRPRRHPRSRCLRTRQTSQDPTAKVAPECVSRADLRAQPRQDRPPGFAFGPCRFAPSRRERALGKRRRSWLTLAPSCRPLGLGRRTGALLESRLQSPLPPGTPPPFPKPGPSRSTCIDERRRWPAPPHPNPRRRPMLGPRTGRSRRRAV